MSFESGRSIGRAATLIILVGTIASPFILLPFIFFGGSNFSAIIVLSVLLNVLGFAGQILFLVAMRRLALFYKAPKIFKNALNGFLTSIIGGGIMLLFFFVFFLSTFRSLTFNPLSGTSAPVFLSILAVVGFVLLFSFVVALVQSLFYRQAFNSLAENSGVDHFRTAGLLMLIGGALTIALVGGLIIFVGWILAAMGFFAMRSPNNFQQQPLETNMKFCPNCGNANPQIAAYCASCGTKLTLETKSDITVST